MISTAPLAGAKSLPNLAPNGQCYLNGAENGIGIGEHLGWSSLKNP
jgi:hypothetical protein